MPNIKLILEYDGSRYYGWQRQPRQPTVQGSLEKALSRIANRRVMVVAAGRTDAGVHAEGQAAHFKTHSRLGPESWMCALNSLLPDDIVVMHAEGVSARFHARYSAIAKTYRYRILNRRNRSAIGRQYVWSVFTPLNTTRMRMAARELTGRHDFSSFQGGSSSSRTSICKMKSLSVVRRGQEVVITIEADRFLQHMIRTIVGTLVEVGRGRRDPSEMKILLKKKDRRLSGPTAPAKGLCLIGVKY